MTEIPGMILWTDAYLADTGHLSTLEHGAYLLILMAMWRNGGFLAKDSKKLAMLAKTPPGHWAKIEKKIMEFMTIEELPNGECKLTQKRLCKEWLQANCRNELRKKAGRSGGLAKALKNKVPTPSNATSVASNAKAIADNYNYNSNIKKFYINGEGRQESRWIPTKRIGSRIFKAGEPAPQYDGQPPQFWQKLKAEDCA